MNIDNIKNEIKILESEMVVKKQQIEKLLSELKIICNKILSLNDDLTKDNEINAK